MARQESDQEDLMAEATALVRRCEIRVAGEPDPIVAGFALSGRLSLYFGSDPVYVFDPAGCLRRAFVAGCQHRSEGVTLARLTKVRTDAETQLVRHDLSSTELESFLAAMRARLARLAETLRAGTAAILATIPNNDQPATALLEAIDRALSNPTPLSRPIKGG